MASCDKTIFLDTYASPVGVLTLASDGQHLCGLWLEGQSHFQEKLEERVLGGKAGEAAGCISGVDAREASPALRASRAWLDAYFEGRDPGALPMLALHGTGFQERVWDELARIPYGRVVSYGDIARNLERRYPGGRVSPRAVGAAVGRNPCSIIVPCHRVIGADGSLTGYAGGIERKRWLLEHEGVEL